MMYSGLRWGSGRLLVLVWVSLTVLVTLYYYSPDRGNGDGGFGFGARLIAQPRQETAAQARVQLLRVEYQRSEGVIGECSALTPANADIDTTATLPKLHFQPDWMKSREYWDANFESRYKARRAEWPKLPLKVIVVPHSHNDPGWLKTFESYYHYQTRNILNNMADKLTTFKNMTFIWTEISFFSQWWQSAHPTKRRLVQKLLDEGRLEITTGGWVMTDEATSHIFAMVDQLIQGHQWLKNKVGITPKSGWSIDPFGHGATIPYLLKAAGFTGGTVIQRIHYAWKQWMADRQAGDFIWRQIWDEKGIGDFLVHNQPFDIYSIKHSCGPHPQICLNFDFRKISGEYTEYSLRAVSIDSENVRQKADLLVEQYGRTGSLYPHNVVLMPLGDDFRYDHDIEWDQQYRNYKRLFDYINSNPRYNAQVVFGTLSDYFKEVRNRMRDFKTLKGDFFVYADIFSEGRPAYWSGYYTTRPYWKILDRELEAELRSAEILYTMSLNRVRRMGYNSTLKILERDFEKLQRARQSLALFQHHDAITGTSKAFVMHDYALKMFEALQDCVSVQGYALQTLLTKPEAFENFPPSTRFILPDTDRESYEMLPTKIPMTIKEEQARKIVLFNSLAQIRHDIIKLRTKNSNVVVRDSSYNLVPFQINPIWNLTDFKNQREYDETKIPELKVSSSVFEVVFAVELPPLSVMTYTLENSVLKKNRATIYCRHCSKNPHFVVKTVQQGDIQLENLKIKLLIDGKSGFLKSVMDKATGRITQCSIQFSAYSSAQFHSGAYLFMPDPNAREVEREILDDYPGQRIVIVSGPVVSTLDVIYGNFLVHSIQIYHGDGPLSEGAYIENIVDFEVPPKNRETELFMRIVSDINNGDPPEFYSDVNGFQTQKRIKVERIGIEGNYYPLTTHAFIQDNEKRLTLLVNHAMGGAAWQPGWLEVMLDRRTLYDDARGMGEGVVDNKRTLMKFWLLIEELKPDENYVSPSLLANYISLGLLYPPNIFILESTNDEATSRSAERNLQNKIHLITRDFPCDVHLMNLRTLQDKGFDHFPSNSALMILHKQGYSCTTPTNTVKNCVVSEGSRAFNQRTSFGNLKASITQVYLTGLYPISKLASLEEVRIRPMELQTFNITFS